VWGRRISIRKLLEVVLDEESNVEVGYESDLWSDH
jgi:hypothetical protein